jgi:hypothetical protein
MTPHKTNNSRKGKEKEVPLASDWFSPIMMGSTPLHTTLNSTQPSNPYPQMPTMKHQHISTILTGNPPNHEVSWHFEIINQTKYPSNLSNGVRQDPLIDLETLIDLRSPSPLPMSSVH